MKTDYEEGGSRALRDCRATCCYRSASIQTPGVRQRLAVVERVTETPSTSLRDLTKMPDFAKRGRERAPMLHFP